MDIMWFVTALSLSGNVLNIKKKRSGFVIWVIANILWLIHDIYTGLYSRAMLDIVQTGFCIWGIIEWNNEEE